jgi:hypothetical protein
MPPKTVQRFEIYAKNTDEVASDDSMWWVFYVIHDYKWQNAATKRVELDYDWAFGRGDDYLADIENRTCTLTANQRAQAVDWEEHHGSRELHTTAMLMMHPDNSRAMMLLLVDLTGNNRAGPIDSTWWETDWLDPGWYSHGEVLMDDNRGWADIDYEFHSR